MRNLFLISLLVLIGLAGLGCVMITRLPGAMIPDTPSQPTLLIEHATLLDPETGQLVRDGSVLIRDGRIAQVVQGEMPNVPADIPRRDATGLTLLPGLIDVHVHVFDEPDLAASLAHGVTTVRNMGGMPFHLPLARRIEAGEVLGPRLITTGPILNETGGRNGNALHESVLGAEEARAAVRRQYAAGFRHLKLYSNLSRESFEAIRAEADILGMSLSGHPVEGTEAEPMAINATLQAGFATIEHTESIVWHGLNDDTDPDGAARLARRIAATGAVIDPTLVVHENLARIVETRGRHLSRPEMASYNPVVAGFERDAFDFWSRYAHSDRTDMQAFYTRFTGMLHQAGVRLTVGSDSGVMASPHGVSTLREMELLVSAGLSPLEAIRAATLNGADVLGLSGQVGCLAPGCAADLVLVSADPLQDIRHLYTPEAVVRNGQWLNRAKLDELETASHHPSELRTWWRLGRHLLATR